MKPFVRMIFPLLLGAALLAGCGGGSDPGNADDGGGSDNNLVDGNLVRNGGFEEPDFPSGSVATVSSAIAGWTLASGAGYEIQDNAGAGVWSAYEGNQYAKLNAVANAAISQAVDTDPGVIYKMCFAYLASVDRVQDTNKIDLYIAGVPVYSVAADGTSMDSAWILHCRTFVAAGGSTAIKFTASGDGVSTGGFLDDVQIYRKD